MTLSSTVQSMHGDKPDLYVATLLDWVKSSGWS